MKQKSNHNSRQIHLCLLLLKWELPLFLKGKGGWLYGAAHKAHCCIILLYIIYYIIKYDNIILSYYYILLVHGHLSQGSVRCLMLGKVSGVTHVTPKIKNKNIKRMIPSQ